MADTKAVVGASIGIALFFILMGGVVMNSYDKAQGNYAYESIDSTAEWEDAINSSASSSYSISNGTMTLSDTSSVVQTLDVATREHNTFDLDASHLSGDLTVTLYAGNGTSLASDTTTGDSDVSLSVSDYNASSYYVEWTSTSSGEVDTYSTVGHSERSGEIQAFLLIAMLLFVVGIAMKFYEM